MTDSIKARTSNQTGTRRRRGLAAVFLLLTLGLYGVAATSASAQLPMPDEDDIAVYASYVVFDDPSLDSLVLVDFPFNLSRSDFEFFRPDTTDPHWYARIFAQVVLIGADGQPVDSVSTYFSARADNPEQAASEDVTLFNRLSMLVDPGIYSAQIYVIDVVNKNKANVFLDQVIANPAPPAGIAIGGEVVAFRIDRVPAGQATDPTVLNGYKVLTSPLGIFNEDDSSMALYAEVYGLEYDPQSPTRLKVAYRVEDHTGLLFRDYGYKMMDKAGNSAVIVDRFDISDWPVGRYVLHMSVTDMATGVNDSTRLSVRVLPEITPAMFASQTAFADPYDTLSLEVKERLVHYILTPVEKRTFESLTDEGKENFLDQYWRENDSDPSTKGLIENRLEMIERYRFANKFFSTTKDAGDGWQTDRGRIYMTYGPWEQRYDQFAPSVGDPYVVWHYHSLREGLLFVFENVSGLEDYQLVHSNAEGEIFSDYWDQFLDRDIFMR